MNTGADTGGTGAFWFVGAFAGRVWPLMESMAASYAPGFPLTKACFLPYRSR